jgi:metallo-beta-lactamase class B
MKRLMLSLAPLLLMGAAAPQQQDWTQIRADWNRPAEPIRIIGNVHYVGTAGLSAYLITGPQGHVLIDGGLPESAELIAANIRALGFRLEDVKVLLINHAHFDHSGGLAELKRLTGARLLASAGDKVDLERGSTEGRDDLDPFPGVKVDAVIGDGEHIRVGAIDLTTHLTPGHTKGCTSWSLRVEEAGKPLDVAFACSLTVAGQDLSGGPGYPGAAGDFRATFATLRGLKADVFLNFHPAAFGFDDKRARLVAGNALAFVDPGELRRRVDDAEAAFGAELAKAGAG